MNTIPDFIVHYSRGEPFCSITSLEQNRIPEVLSKLNETNSWGLARFSHPGYLTQRFEIESYLRQRFIQMGGRPHLKHPIYFFLGRNTHFEQYEKNIGYMINLKDIAPGFISFTYGDSMFCLNNENRQQAGKKYQNPLCENLYSLETLSGLFSSRTFPKVAPLHVEAQLWIQPDKEIVKRLER